MTKITVDKALIEQAIAAMPDRIGVSRFALRQKLRAALAEPAPEPVTYWDTSEDRLPVRPSKYDPEEHPNHIPLYAAPVLVVWVIFRES